MKEKKNLTRLGEGAKLQLVFVEQSATDGLKEGKEWVLYLQRTATGTKNQKSKNSWVVPSL